MMLRVWACLAGFMAMLGALAAPSTAALRYTGFGATLASRTNGAPQAIPATVLRPEGEGPFPAIVTAHDCSGLGAPVGLPLLHSSVNHFIPGPGTELLTEKDLPVSKQANVPLVFPYENVHTPLVKP